MKALGWETEVTEWLIRYNKRDLPENRGILRLGSTRQETVRNHKETTGKQHETVESWGILASAFDR